MTDPKKRSLFKKLIRLITFVDLPIRRKFTLFSIGVLFWFVVLSSVSFYVLIDVNIKTAQVLDSLIPFERIAQNTLRKSNESCRLIKDMMLAATEQGVAFKEERVNANLKALKENLDQLNSPEIISPVQLLWGNISNNSWLDESGNNAYMTLIDDSNDKLLQLLKEISFLKNGSIKSGVNNTSQIENLVGRFVAIETKLNESSVSFLESISQQVNHYSTSITTTTSYAFWMIITVLALASGLLAVFTFWISDSIVLPVSSMIAKIHTLATGHVDLTDKIAIRSDDEIGEMSKEFNDLMDTVHGMTVFKNVIEEDATLEDVYSRMGDAFSNNVGIESYRIYEVSPDYKGMQAVYPIALSDNELDCHPDILSNCELCRAVKTGHPISSLAYDRVCKQFKEDQKNVHICVPMIIGGHAGGVVQFIFKKDDLGRAKVEQLVAKADAYIKQSLSVLEAKRLMHTLRESSLRDPMTGLFNRRFLQDQASHLIASALRRKNNIGLIMCDIDFFKQVNDKYGHDAGDEVLKETSTIILSSVRDSDIVIRFGGEEFLVILTDIDSESAIDVAEKIRKNIEAKMLRVGSETFHKTISMGVSEFPGDSDGFWQAIKYADVALYQAKETGRNKSVRFEKEMWTEDEF